MIHIRKLGPADAALFREMRLEALRLHPDAFTGDLADESAQTLAVFAEITVKSAVFAAFRGDEALGLAAVSPQRGRKKAHLGLLWAVYVRATARGLGAGRQLIDAVLHHAAENFEIVQLAVAATNLPARQLYESLGFTAYGLEKYAIKHEHGYGDYLLMMKILRPIPAP